MPDHGHAHKGPPDTSRGFEQSDLEFGAIGKGVLFYFIFTGAIGVVVFLGFLFFHQAQIPQQSLSTVPTAPYPLLQNDFTNRTDIWNLRAREDYLLHNYTYVDSTKKVVRVPVDQVLDQLGQSDNPSVLNPTPAANPPAPQATPPALSALDGGRSGDAALHRNDKPIWQVYGERGTKSKPMPAPLKGSLKINPNGEGQ